MSAKRDVGFRAGLVGCGVLSLCCQEAVGFSKHTEKFGEQTDIK